MSGKPRSVRVPRGKPSSDVSLARPFVQSSSQRLPPVSSSPSRNDRLFLSSPAEVNYFKIKVTKTMRVWKRLTHRLEVSNEFVLLINHVVTSVLLLHQHLKL